TSWPWDSARESERQIATGAISRVDAKILMVLNLWKPAMTSTLVRLQAWHWFAPVTVAGLLACGGGGTSSPKDSIVVVPRSVVWSDEFDGPAGSAIDAAKWRFDLGDGCQAGNCGWGNNEKEYYTSATENISLNGQGQLQIVARKAPAGLTCYYGPCKYTSAKVTTRGFVTAQPGRVEARIKLASGQGLWPAFWMLGNNFPNTPWPQCGEIDIMENHGSDLTSTSSAVHGPGYSGNTPFARAFRLGNGSFADDFHVFAVEWDADRI